MRTFVTISLLLVLSFSKSFADVSPSTEEIFAAENLRGVLPCAALIPESRRGDDDWYCGIPVPTFDPRSGTTLGPKEPKPIYLTGGEGIGNVFVYDQQPASTTDSYFLIDSVEGRVWVRASTKDLRALEAAMPDQSGGASLTYDLHPSLREVYLDQDGKQPMPVGDILALKGNPNSLLGFVEVALDRDAVSDPESGQSMRFSYPYHGETTLSSYELFQASEAAARESNPPIDPLNVQLPVFRKTGDRYLVAIPNQWTRLLYKNNRYNGAMTSSALEFDGSVYGWIESKGISLNWRAVDIERFPSYQEGFASVDFRMERGLVFERNGVRWTSLKIVALYLDFDTPQPEDDYGVIRRREVPLREVFLPLYDARNRIQLWTSWSPGC